MADNTINRPLGQLDALGRVVPNSYEDEAFRGIYDASNNLIYKGFARPGAIDTRAVWQIAKLTYDASNNLLNIKWPQNATGKASSEYEFIWNDGVTSYLTYTYS
jgi:hypothetical protein